MSLEREPFQSRGAHSGSCFKSSGPHKKSFSHGCSRAMLGFQPTRSKFAISAAQQAYVRKSYIHIYINRVPHVVSPFPKNIDISADNVLKPPRVLEEAPLWMSCNLCVKVPNQSTGIVRIGPSSPERQLSISPPGRIGPDRVGQPHTESIRGAGEGGCPDQIGSASRKCRRSSAFNKFVVEARKMK